MFSDGPAPTGQRWCNNGVALRFKPRTTTLQGKDRALARRLVVRPRTGRPDGENHLLVDDAQPLVGFERHHEGVEALEDAADSRSVPEIDIQLGGEAPPLIQYAVLATFALAPTARCRVSGAPLVRLRNPPGLPHRSSLDVSRHHHPPLRAPARVCMVASGSLHEALHRRTIILAPLELNRYDNMYQPAGTHFRIVRDYRNVAQVASVCRRLVVLGLSRTRRSGPGRGVSPFGI